MPTGPNGVSATAKASLSAMDDPLQRARDHGRQAPSGGLEPLGEVRIDQCSTSTAPEAYASWKTGLGV